MNEDSYASLLKSKEWKDKREEILHRDKRRCILCGDPGSEWIPGENKGGFNIIIIENNPVTEFPKTVKFEKKVLHIHHKYYKLIEGKLAKPWEYKNDALETLCHVCHKNVHESEKTPILKLVNNDLIPIENFELCSRCYGEGYFIEYSHVKNGICFKCRGKRFYIN